MGLSDYIYYELGISGGYLNEKNKHDIDSTFRQEMRTV